MNLELPYDALIGMITGTTILGIVTVIAVTTIKIAKIKNSGKCGCK